MISLWLVVVIYNKSITNSITVNFIKGFAPFYGQNLKIIIVDNSDDDKIQKDNQKNNESLFYISMNGNKGLSKAYNKAVLFVKNQTPINEFQKTYIMTLDDDTKITAEYVSSVFSLLSKKPMTDLIMPIIISNKNSLLSPSKFSRLRLKKLKNLNQIKKLDYKHIVAINTCLVIKLTLFQFAKYDESLFLDQIDNQFFCDIRKRPFSFVVIDNYILQNFFSEDNTNMEKGAKRKKIEISDYKTYVKNKSLLEKFLFPLRVLFWKIKGVLKFKSFRFLLLLK